MQVGIMSSVGPSMGLTLDVVGRRSMARLHARPEPDASSGVAPIACGPSAPLPTQWATFAYTTELV